MDELTSLEQKIYNFIKKEKEVPYIVLCGMFSGFLLPWKNPIEEVDTIGNILQSLEARNLIKCDNEIGYVKLNNG